MSYTPYYPPCPWPHPWRGYYIDAYGVPWKPCATATP